MMLKGKRPAVAALATMTIMLTAGLFTAGSASAAQSTAFTVPPSTVIHHGCNPIVILDRAPC